MTSSKLATTKLRQHASPLLGSPIPLEDGDTLSSRYSVEATEPVLDGHFPGLAIFPGVCLIECAHLTALAELQQAAGDRGAPRLTGIESARFLAPVFPGDEVRADVSVRNADAGEWVCTATVSVRGTQAGAFRLRYRAEPAGQDGGQGA